MWDAHHLIINQYLRGFEAGESESNEMACGMHAALSLISIRGGGSKPNETVCGVHAASHF